MIRTFTILTGAGLLLASGSCASQSLIQTLSPKDLATEQQVKQLDDAVAAALSRCEDVTLRFHPGIYRRVYFFIDDRGRRAGCNASFSIDRTTEGGTVAFEGGQMPKFIDVVTHEAAFPGTIRNILVRDYVNGIVVTRTNSNKGERITPATQPAADSHGGAGLIINSILFQNLGDQNSTKGASGTGWGAIVFNYASNNRVIGNRFEGLGNAVDSILMHAVYLAGSSGNTIQNNYFGAMDGEVIKLRDRANNNQISNNRFRYGGQPLLQLWFCNRSERGSGACPTNECPSSGTIFERNRILAGGQADRTRRGGGAAPIKNPFVSYESVKDLKLIERYYVDRGTPTGCGDSSSAPVIRDRSNLIQRAN